MLAVGRVPNTDDLGLETAGITTDKRGYVEVDEALRTSNPHVWALGDCNGKGAFTHTAYSDYEIVADNLLSNAGRKYTDRLPVYALYTDPPLGRVGMSEAEIRKSGLKALVGKRPMSRVARAVEKGETRGFLKIHVEQGSQRILGAALLTLWVSLGVERGFLTILAAHVMFNISFVVVTVRARLAGMGRTLEEAGMDLYADARTTFWKVTFPLIFPGILSAALLAFALSIDDYVITLFSAGR